MVKNFADSADSAVPASHVDPRFVPRNRFDHPDSRIGKGSIPRVQGATAASAGDALIYSGDIGSEIPAILGISRECVYWAFQFIYEETITEPDIKSYLVRNHISLSLLGGILQVIRACTPYISKHAPAIKSEGPFENGFDLLSAFIAHIKKNAAHPGLGTKLEKIFLSVPNVLGAA